MWRRERGEVGRGGGELCEFRRNEETSTEIHADYARTDGLYFMLEGNTYPPGAEIPITEVGAELSHRDPGSSLLCMTTNVNPLCCRRRNRAGGARKGGTVGGWFFPNGTEVNPRSPRRRMLDFSRSHFAHQVRLNRQNNPVEPTGGYQCRVAARGSGRTVTATVFLLTSE